MEMMESFEETRICPTHTDPCDLHDVKVHEVNLAANCAALIANKQNFDFGAEIVGTQTIAEREFNVKTNQENIATTATVATVAVAASTSSDGKYEENIEMPLNVAELSQSKDNFVNNEGSQANDDDKDSGDSYQSDEDAEDDDANAESQQECSPTTVHNDASQESDDSTSDSDFSDLSGLSDMSGREWKPISARPINWVQKQIHAGANPRELLSQMLPSNAQPIAPGVNDMLLWRILASMLSEPPRRQKLRYINTFEDVIQLIQQSKNIIVLTGAGVSVSCGIPDFRSSDGIYSRLAKDFPNLPDPQAMFDINYFSRDPRPFFKFAREIYPGQFKPSPCHRFIKLLEEKNKLLRNYTQNIDTLEQVAGIKNVIECHGSFSTASCTKCKVKCTADAIREDIFSQRIPVCRRCQPNVHQSVNASDPVSDANLSQIVENGIMKPDIVFFGEGLPEEFHTVMASDKDSCDLLIVIGSSLKVRPVALIPSSIPASVPQILINREQLHHLEFDVELLGDSDVIINQLCHRLGNEWKEICYDNMILKESKELLPLEEIDTNDESEEDGHQMVDTDTQSVKSSASTDLALRSAGTYSDSGFESFTSSGMVVAKPTTATMGTNIEAREAIEKIKSNMLELKRPLITTTTTTTAGAAEAAITMHESSDLRTVRVNYLEEEPNDAEDFENRSFQPFNARVTEPNRTTTYGGMNARHLSIDSSKDSGIHGDLSNPALVTNIGTLPPPITSFGDSGGTTVIDELSVASSTTTCADKNKHTKASAPPATTATTATTATIPTIPTTPTIRNATQTSTTDGNSKSDCQKPIATKKYRSAAERLLEGTYYAHDTTSAYVFPGAQVSWWSDAEDEEENNDIIANEYDEEDVEDMDVNCAPLSPLMPPSVEAEVVSEITTTSAFGICAAKPSPMTANNSSSSATVNTVDTQKPATATSTTNRNVSILSNITTAASTYSSNAAENATGKNKVAAPPTSPQKRVCECPSTLSSNNSKQQQQNITERKINCNISISNDDGDGDKCECSPPPLKRKRSIDDKNVLCVDQSTTAANIAAAEANVVSSTTNIGIAEMSTSTVAEFSLQQI